MFFLYPKNVFWFWFQLLKRYPFYAVLDTTALHLTVFLYFRLITTSWPASVRFWLFSCPRPLQRFSRYSTRLLRWSIFPASANFAVWPLSINSSSYQSRQSRLPRSTRCSTLQHVFRPLSALFSGLCRLRFLPLLILISASADHVLTSSLLDFHQCCGCIQGVKLMRNLADPDPGPGHISYLR